MRAGQWQEKFLTAIRRIEASSPLGVREFLWLCLPALVISLFVRAHFLWVTPQGYFGSDSRSYFHFSHELFIDGEFDLSPKRRWFYPIVLILLTPLPIASWYLVPILQHLLGLATIVNRLDHAAPLPLAPLQRTDGHSAMRYLAATVGQNSQGYWLLLNSVLPLVQESGQPYARYRAALRPLILETRRSGDNYPWIKSK